METLSITLEMESFIPYCLWNKPAFGTLAMKRAEVQDHTDMVIMQVLSEIRTEV